MNTKILIGLAAFVIVFIYWSNLRDSAAIYSNLIKGGGT